MTGKGTNYENQLVNALCSVVTTDVWVGSVGYSGNAKNDHCDLMIAVSPKLATAHESLLHAVEVKKRSANSGNRVYLNGGTTGETGLAELRRLVEQTPSWSTAWLAIKFDRRELMVIEASRLLFLSEEAYSPADDSPCGIVDPHVTDSDAISIRKPTTDEWDSATAGQSDERVLADVCGLPTQTSET